MRTRQLITTMSVEILIHDTTTTAVIRSGTYTEVGTAHRHPDDHHDPELALGLAMGRALRQLGRDMLRDANAAVRANAETAQRQREATAAYRVAQTAKRQRGTDVFGPGTKVVPRARRRSSTAQ